MNGLMSPFALRGLQYGFRDDLFNALHVLAVLLMGRPFTNYVHALKSEDEFTAHKLVEFKEQMYYFAIASVRNGEEQGKPNAKKEVYRDSECYEQLRLLDATGIDIYDPVLNYSGSNLSQQDRNEIRLRLCFALNRARDQKSLYQPARIAEVKEQLEAALSIIDSRQQSQAVTSSSSSSIIDTKQTMNRAQDS